MQKEFYRFFNLKVPEGLTHNDALRFISGHEARLGDHGEEQMEEWEAYENIYDEITDPDFREDYEIKKISLSVYRAAIEELRKEGKKLPELADDVDVVVEKITEMKPELRKA